MLTIDDKKYIQDGLDGLEAKIDDKFDRKLGMYHEQMLGMFQHFTEMIMAHIDKKFERVAHGKNIR